MHFTEAELYKKNTETLKSMLLNKCGIDWYDFPAEMRNGTCCSNMEHEVLNHGKYIQKKGWVIEYHIPIFSGEGRHFIDKIIGYKD
jgi:hypothetical protein